MIIGPDQERLSVPKSILTDIPYFKSALSSGLFCESQTKTFDLPNDKPKPIADVIYYAYTKRVDSKNLKKVTEDYAYDLIEAYIVADKYKVEDVANRLAEEIIRYYKRYLVDPEAISILGNADMDQSSVYTALILGMAYSMIHKRYDKYWGTDEDGTTFEEHCELMSPRDLRNLFKAVGELSS